MTSRLPRSEEAGQVSVLIIGFTLVLLIAVGVVVDASAAYLQRQGLDSLSDGAALAGATIEGREGYVEGLGGDRLQIDIETARAAVATYVEQVGAHADFDELAWQVSVDGDRVVVRMSAAMQLPIDVAGVTDTRVTSTGSASLLLGG